MTNNTPESNPPAAGIVPELLTTKQAAELISCGERTLWRWSRSGIAPAPVRIAGTVRYDRATYLAWIRAGCPRCDAQKKGGGQ
jgi:predicted DNA-binding transcriptional regulator AlpA